MEKQLVVFGASGRAGRRAVSNALAAGHRVTAVVRDPSTTDLSHHSSLTIVAGDVADASSVEKVAAGHDAAIMTAARLDMSSVDFYTAATTSLIAGLEAAGVPRLVAAGVGTTLEVQPGLVMHDLPEFPEEGRAFSLGHAAEWDLLRSRSTSLDWVVLVPPPIMLDDTDERGNGYQFGGNQMIDSGGTEQVFSYGDFGAVLVQEAASPQRHRELVAVARTA